MNHSQVLIIWAAFFLQLETNNWCVCAVRSPGPTPSRELLLFASPESQFSSLQIWFAVEEKRRERERERESKNYINKTPPRMNFQSGVPVSGLSQQSQPAMPTPGTVPAPVPVPVPQSIPSQFGSGSSGASSGAGQFGSGTVSGQSAQSGPAGSQFVLSNSAAIRAEIHRFESVHPNIYAIYDLIERIDDLALQNQIREHVISIEGE